MPGEKTRMPGEKLDMTEDEMKNLTEALKKEEFRKMLFEYAEELKDPEKRKQYEEELVQLESQRGVDMKFIKPDPGFVIKVLDSAQTKVFVNVCSSKDIAVPEFKMAEQAGEGGKVERGQQCSLPYSLSPVHKEPDNKGVECDVYDVVFNPEVLARCQNPRFKDMVVGTALEGVVSNFKLQLNRDTAKFPKLKFKGTPSESVIRNRVAEEETGAFNHLPKRPEFPVLPGEEKKAKKEEKKVSNGVKKPDDEPEYKMVYRDQVDFANFTNSRVSNAARPSAVTITISLPKHAGARDVNLDVYPDSMELHSKHYNLDLDLPYEVDSDNGKAKFDKEKKQLVVTLNIIPKLIKESELLVGVPEPSLVEEILENGEEAPGNTDSNESDRSCNGITEVHATEEKGPGQEEVKFEEQAEKKDPAECQNGPERGNGFISEVAEGNNVDDKVNLTETSKMETAEPAKSPSPSISEATEETNSKQEAPSEEPTHPNPSKTDEPKTESASGDLVPEPSPETEPNDLPSACISEVEIIVPEHASSPVASNEEKHVDNGIGNELGEIFLNEEESSVTSGMSSYTDCTLENNLSVAVRVYQDMTTVTILLDTVYNRTPDVKTSGKKMWLDNEDVSLYMLLPHNITTYTINMSYDNTCIVVYKQHKGLWRSIYIGHSEEEVFPFKFITEDNINQIVDTFVDPWTAAAQEGCRVTPHVTSHGDVTEIGYTVNNRPDSIPIYTPSEEEDEDDPLIRGILKSPHSPPPISPRSRKVSFNDSVETFMLPSKRSLKGKKRRKRGSNSSASESSDDASSPSPTSPIGNQAAAAKSGSAGLKLDSAEDSWSPGNGKKGGKKNRDKGKGGPENKENVIQTQREAVQCLDPAGANSHKMLLANSHIYELED